MKSLLTVVFCFIVFVVAAQTSHLLIGTYTSGKSEGIYVYSFDSKTGDIKLESKIKASNPSYLAIAPNQQFVYAVYEEGNNNNIGGSVAAYSFNKSTGELTAINQQLSGGDHPCYVAVDKTGKWVTAGNYSGGSLSVLPILENGGLGPAGSILQHTGTGPVKDRQDKAHVHCTYFSKDNKYLFVPDLGMDKVMIYAFDATKGHLHPAPMPFVKAAPGSGPRHIDFHPNNKYAYLMQELTGKVAVYKYSNGKLTNIQNISAAPKGFKGFMGSADIHVSPDGRFLYCSNRGQSNSISIFSINAANGTLKLIGNQTAGIATPRNFNFDPTGNFLLVANQTTDNISIFTRNKKTGLLTDTGKKIEVGNPVCLKWINN